MANALEDLIAEGIVQGRAEGQEEGKRIALRTLVELRFGAVPSALEERIAAATGNTLDALYVRAVRADRIEAIEQSS